MPRRVLQGRVTSDKMDKTITVLVSRRIMHPLYKKFIRRSKKYAAHDELNECREGDTVRIVECAPISRRKTWTVVQRNGAVLRNAEPDAVAAAADDIVHDQAAGISTEVPAEVAAVIAEHTDHHPA